MKIEFKYQILRYIFLATITSAFVSNISAQSNTTLSEESFRRPWFGQVQYAGNMGRFSIGVGKYFYRDNFLLSLHYGHTPQFNEGGNTVISYTLKNTLIPARISIGKNYSTSPELGWAVTYSGNTPIPLLMFGGVRIERKVENSLISTLGAFFHVGTNSIWLLYASDNKEVGIEYLYNFSTGLQVNF